MTGISRGAAGNDDDLIDGFQQRFFNAQFIDSQIALFIHTPHQGIAQGSRLVVDFFFHEGGKAALFGSGSVPLNIEALALLWVAVIIGDRHDVIVVHLNGSFRVVNKARDIGSQEVLALSQANNQSRIPARSHNLIWLVGVNSQKGKGAIEKLASLTHSKG